MWRSRLTEALTGSGIGEDTEAAELARAVLAEADLGGTYILDLRESRGIQVGDSNVQTNTFN